MVYISGQFVAVPLHCVKYSFLTLQLYVNQGFPSKLLRQSNLTVHRHLQCMHYVTVSTTIYMYVIVEVYELSFEGV